MIDFIWVYVKFGFLISILSSFFVCCRFYNGFLLILVLDFLYLDGLLFGSSGFWLI